MKQIIKLFKKIVINAFLLYGYNLLVGPIGLMVPINFITISILTIFGIPSLFSLILILILIF